MFKSRRQHRYQILRDTGFLPFEAKDLSKIPFNVPYIDEMIKERYRQLKVASKQGITKKDWDRIIKEAYLVKDFTKKLKNGKIVLDSWQFMRDFEYKFKRKHPEYESPWEKRRRDWKDFTKKIENTYSKYPAGAAYNKKSHTGQQIRYKPEGGAELVEEQRIENREEEK